MQITPEEQIQAIRNVKKQVLKNKESALQYLRELGIGLPKEGKVKILAQKNMSVIPSPEKIKKKTVR